MVNATAMTNSGWDYIGNTSNFNIVRGSLEAWQHNPVTGDFAWILLSLIIIFAVPIIIYMRSQNMVASVFGLILITSGMHYYGYLYSFLAWPIYVISALSLAIAFAVWLKNK